VNESVFVTAAKRCVTIHEWQLQVIAWILIGYGAFVSLAGGFASGTVVGLPVGAVAIAAGVSLATTAQFFLWKVDQQRWSSKRVCF
jgi:hypothetical protein